MDERLFDVRHTHTHDDDDVKSEAFDIIEICEFTILKALMMILRSSEIGETKI